MDSAPQIKAVDQKAGARPAKARPRPRKKLGEVRVRMYRVGFGDCFLLTFVPMTGEPHYMLIDFGVFQSTRGAGEKMNQVAKNIRADTGDHLHTVIATHEHADHLSGFKLAADELRNLHIDELWLSWTSDYSDVDGKRRSDKARRVCLAANAAVLRMPEEKAKSIRSVLEFGANTPENCSSSPLWSNLQNFERTLFLEPDDVIDLKRLGVRIYVLGPSREIFQPRNTQTSQPGQGLALNQATAFLAAAVEYAGLSEAATGDLSTSDLAELSRLSMPFDRRRGIPLSELKTSTPSEPSTAVAEDHDADQAFFYRTYGISDGQGQGPAWRRIDSDWLNAAEALALSIDHSVNNTSLVLAIELVESGKVLLFPGDAQIESWKTWKNKSASVEDLLNRTILYKIGHHGSHNATYKEDGAGIHLMKHPDLVALLPLDEAKARDEIGWDMPDAEVFDLVSKHSRGRILRIDISKNNHTIPTREAGVSEVDWKYSFLPEPDGWEAKDWKDNFLKAVGVDEKSGEYLWLEYRIRP